MGLKDWLLRSGRNSGSADIAGCYADIQRWEDIYNGGGDWRYARRGGIQGGTRKLASLGAARALCGELARLCFTEGTSMCYSDSDTESFVNRVLTESRFSERFPVFLEKVFALGGGVIKVYYDDSAPDGVPGVRVDLVTADCFLPTAWNSREITGGAFASRIVSGGRNYILAESQELSGDQLTIENRLFREDGGKADMTSVLPGLSGQSSVKGLTAPLFVYLSAGSRRAASSGECPLLGSSVFDGAEDTLKSIDIVFDSLSREFVLGKKRIIVPAYAVRGEWDAAGNKKHYFDVNDEVFQRAVVDFEFGDNARAEKALYASFVPARGFVGFKRFSAAKAVHDFSPLILTFPMASRQEISSSPKRSFWSIFQFRVITPSSQPSGISPSKNENSVFEEYTSSDSGRVSDTALAPPERR